MKKNPLNSSSWPLIFIFVGIYSCLSTHFVSCQCPHHQKTWLLELKNIIKINSDNLSDNLADWNQSTDCCQWNRVECDDTLGGVCVLDLSNINMKGPIPKPISKFRTLQNLDLSMNQISGKVPGWLWRTGVGPMGFQFNLSFNHLVGFEPPLELATSPIYLYLQNNNFQGQFPVVAEDIVALDCSNNNFTSIHPDLGEYLPGLAYFSFSKNKLSGGIPTGLCNDINYRGLQLVDLAFNHLNGTIPECLIRMSTELTVLNLRNNNLEGVIPDKFGMFDIDVNVGCGLKTLNLNGNFLRGKIPPSLGNCTDLQVLDLGNNQIDDTFPCHLNRLVNLQVLILGSNNFHGTMVCPESRSFWPMLQIVDVASNHFSGELRSQMLMKWKAMMAGTSAIKSKAKPGHLEIDMFPGYYQNQVTVTDKNNIYDLQYILTIFKSIDFSNNKFYGELPRELGNLNALIVLNLSHNSFSGNIPSSVGNLTQIESLDLSCNAFRGNIPPQLANLDSLGALNLSFNNLSGKIPVSNHLLTFDASSYKGNTGLYGPPLTPINRSEPDPRTTSEGMHWSSKMQIEWMLMGAEVGFPVGLTIFLGPLLYIKRHREWYCKHLHKLIMKILGREDTPSGRRRRGSRQQRQRR